MNVVIIENDIVIQTTESNISIENRSILINISGQGPQGVPGTGFPAGGLEGQALVKKSDANYDTEWRTIGNVFIATAGQVISALKIVYTDPTTGKILYADKDLPDSVNSLLGVTTQAGIEDDNISVTTAGQLQDSSWNWDMSGNVNLFLGSNGTITQGLISGAAIARIGYAISSTEIFIRIGDSIFTN